MLALLLCTLTSIFGQHILIRLRAGTRDGLAKSAYDYNVGHVLSRRSPTKPSITLATRHLGVCRMQYRRTVLNSQLNLEGKLLNLLRQILALGGIVGRADLAAVVPDTGLVLTHQQ